MLPISICNALDRSFKNFWCGFPKDKSRNLSLKSWSSICMPHNPGGLGIRDMKSTNLALIAKLGWNILNNSDNIWVQLLQKKYIRYENFLTSLPTLISGQLHGYLHYLISSLCQNSYIIGTCQLHLYQNLLFQELISGIKEFLI
jgi:hypothetical protein